MRNLLCKVWDTALGAAGLAWRRVLDVGWALWREVTEGASRASWWLLIVLAWLDGLITGWLIWVN